MNILHYTLGFPPYRSGGLIRYAHDLMVAQIGLGHNVCCLYAGSIRLLHRHTAIRQEHDVDGIKVYELRNPLPVPLLYGLPANCALTDDSVVNEKEVCNFFDNVQPEVLHIHTLMGLPKRIIEIAKEHGIKIVYTTHDYFGLCPKVNFINSKGVLCNCASPGKCTLCNRNAKSVMFLRMRNSKWLLPFKGIARRYFK